MSDERPTPRTDAVRHATVTKLVELPGGDSIDGMTRYYAEDDFNRAIRLAMKLERENAALFDLIKGAHALLYIARGAALKLRATGCNHAEGCELVRNYEAIMEWSNTAIDTVCPRDTVHPLSSQESEPK